MKITKPRGIEDITFDQTKKWQRLEQIIRDTCFVYNYHEIRIPIFEHTELFKRQVGETTDVVNKEMYTFTDKGNRSLTLRPEGTAGVIRSYVENKMFGLPDQPTKLYYIGPMFRYERPQKGRLRQHHQFGVEAIGVKDPYLDVEVIMIGISICQMLGLKDLKVKINSLGNFEERKNHKAALIDHFKPVIHEFCEDCQNRLELNPLRILDCKVDHDHEAIKTSPLISDYLTEESKNYFEAVIDTLDAFGVAYEVDPHLVRGLDYYTHTVFEVVSTNSKMGSQSTIFGGGRYDGLVSQLDGPEVSGIGFGMGLDRLLIALENEDINLYEEQGIDCYVLPLDETSKEYASIVLQQLRINGYRSEMDYQNRKFKAQFKSVERLNSKIALLVGETEALEGTVTVKDLVNKTQVNVAFDDLIDLIDGIMLNHEGGEH